MFSKLHAWSARTQRLGRLRTLLLLAAAGALLGCGEDDGPSTASAPTVPDLRFEPSTLTVGPGDTVRTTVRVEPAADLRGATFTLDGAPPGLATQFTAAADGATGTLMLTASANVKAIAWSLTVKGRRADGAKTWVGSLSLSISRTSARSFFVDPANGNDTNRGTQDKPVKTLGKALSSARAGDTVKLGGGGYGPTAASGEQFPANGLVVPSGVMIEGALDSGFPVSTLVGTGDGVGLNFAGDATVRNLFIGGAGFGVGMFAKQGKQTLSNVFIGVPGRVGTVDGTPLSGGIVLRGTAQATLLAGASQANRTGSTIVVFGAVGAELLEQAQLTLSGVTMTINKGTGVSAAHGTQLTMDGGKIARGDNLTCPTGNGIVLRDSAQATLKSFVSLTNLGTALSATNATKATLLGTTIKKEYGSGCIQSPSVSAIGPVTLAFDGATISATGGQGQGDIGIQTGAASGSGNATLTLKATTVAGHTDTGIELNQSEILTIEAGNIVRNGIGIEAIRSDTRPKITITGAALLSNTIGVRVFEPIFKLRKSSVRENGTGIDVRGQVGFVFCSGPCADLGTVEDPGNNNFAGNTTTGVFLSNDHDANQFTAVTAVGNTWNPNTQGSNSSGQYTTRLRVLGSDLLAKGKNFIMARTGSFIDL